MHIYIYIYINVCICIYRYRYIYGVGVGSRYPIRYGGHANIGPTSARVVFETVRLRGNLNRGT